MYPVDAFIAALEAVALPAVFNPYAHRCPHHDVANAPRLRWDNLRRGLLAAARWGSPVDLWLARAASDNLSAKWNCYIIFPVFCPVSRPRSQSRH